MIRKSENEFLHARPPMRFTFVRDERERVKNRLASYDHKLN